MQELPHPQPTSKVCWKWREHVGILRVGGRMWNHHWQESWFWESGQGRNGKCGEWKQVVAREKRKFKTKITRGKGTVKWGKRKEGQNMWIEVSYSLKSSGLICTNLKDKKWMLTSYAGKKISQIMVETTVDFVSVASSIYDCFFLSGSISGDVRWWPPSELRKPVQDYQGSTVCGWLLQLLI